MKSETTFVKRYFDNKSLAQLKTTITPAWDAGTTQKQMAMIDVPDDAEFVCEFGCGIGRMLVEVAEMPKVKDCLGLDASGSMINNAIKHENIVYGLANAFTPFEYEAGEQLLVPFDFVFCWLVCQHVPSTSGVETMTDNAHAILRDGGTLRFQLLANDEQPGRDLWSWHDPERLVRYMQKAGWANVVCEMITGRWLMITGVK